MLNGHYHGASYETTVFDDDKDGVYDRTVYQICTDYQSGFEGGSGYIKMLYFDLDNNKIYINSYSPSLDDFNYYDNTSVTELGTESAASVAPDTAADGSALPKRINNNINTDILTLDVNFHTDPQTILTSYFGAYLDRGEEIGTADFTVAQDSNRTGTAALTWDGLQPGTAYAWYAQVTNTLGSIQQTAVQRFTTAAVPADVPPTPGNAPPSRTRGRTQAMRPAQVIQAAPAQQRSARARRRPPGRAVRPQRPQRPSRRRVTQCRLLPWFCSAWAA